MAPRKLFTAYWPLLALCMACPAQAESNALEPVYTQLRSKQFSSAVELLKPIANANDAAAELLLGNLYRNGLGVTQDNTQARHWIQRAAEHGNVEAAYILATILAGDDPSNQADIDRWLQRAAQAGHSLAAQALRDGIVPQQFQPAIALKRDDVRQTTFWLAASHDDIKTLQALNNTEMLNSVDAFGRSALFYAAHADANQALSWLLQAGADLDLTDQYGVTPLMLAAGAGHTHCVTQLIAAGANLNTQDQAGNTALMYAIGKQHSDAAAQLLQSTANIQLLNTQNWSVLDWAVHTNNQEIANQLRARGLNTNRQVMPLNEQPSIPLRHAAADDLYRGWPDALIAVTRDNPTLQLALPVNKNALTPHGQNALLVAVQASNTEAIDNLLEAGIANSNDADETPLSWAVRHQQTNLAKQLLSKGINANTHGRREAAPLVDALRHNDNDLSFQLVELLLAAGANTETRDAQDRTPLIISTARNQTNIVKRLLSSGANTNATDQHGRTALMYAALNGANDALRLLLDTQADINQHDNSDASALMLAAANGQKAAVELLVAAGARTQGSKTNTNALMLAAAQGDATIVIRLLNAGFKPNLQNQFGDTALMFAARNGQTAAARALLAAGANLNLRNNDRATAQDIAERLAFTTLSSMFKQAN